MNTVHNAPDTDAGNPQKPVVALWTGLASVAQALLLFVPLTVLGRAINWPESLDDPASVALPRLLENEGAVRFGYVVYLIYSILFAATIALIVRYAKGTWVRVLGALIIGFAIASALARSIGIIRWLAPMPELANLWQSASTDEQRYSLEVMFETLNSFGGTIGEVLGVGMFAFVAIMLLSIATMRDGSLPGWIGAFGVIAALGVLAGAAELLGIDPEPIVTMGTTLVQFWFLAVGIWLLTRGRGGEAA